MGRFHLRKHVLPPLSSSPPIRLFLALSALYLNDEREGYRNHLVVGGGRSLHGFVPVTPEAEAPRCAKAASRCFSLRCDRHKVLTWEWRGASCYLRLGAALKRPV
ncbi:unnamed protein product [Pleuronectes platessa]|uniref:Uncharacterized protein n=1 Tax=Pleuronectes platessa TaxID=8262 RepID=A0A9N7YTL6_PLEPL|nr:unnamed protein product [Pleuronectes platessa]